MMNNKQTASNKSLEKRRENAGAFPTSQLQRYERKELKINRSMILRFIAWPIWCYFLISIFVFIPITNSTIEESSSNIDSGDWFLTVVIAIAIFTVIEVLLTITIRHFALIRPKREGALNLNTLGGGVRFILVNILNWFLAESIAVYGMVLYVISERIVFLYIFALVGVSLLVFHNPRLTPYQSVS